MKTIEFNIGPKTLHLYMNGEAMFAIQALDDTLSDGSDAVSSMMRTDSDGLHMLCQIAHILATQGELCRRYLQYTPARIPTVEELKILLSPMQIVGLRTAVIQAINDGYSQPGTDDAGDIDTGLAELEKKRNLNATTVSADGRGESYTPPGSPAAAKPGRGLLHV
ncbi:MAG: hypothetical protein ACI3VZ_08205 [Faecousia sp.]